MFYLFFKVSKFLVFFRITENAVSDTFPPEI